MLEFYSGESRRIRKEASTDAAWLSSARTLKRSLKWGNERNPYRVLQVSHGTAQPRVRET